MAIAKIEPLPKFDLGIKLAPWEQRRARWQVASPGGPARVACGVEAGEEPA